MSFFIRCFFNIIFSYLLFIFWISHCFFSLTNVHENPNKNIKMNFILMNIAHFFDMYLFCFMAKSNIIIVTISNSTTFFLLFGHCFSERGIMVVYLVHYYIRLYIFRYFAIKYPPDRDN